MNTPKLHCVDLHVAFDGNKVLTGFSHIFNPGITALVGNNGSGKSTLINVISGFLKPNSGKVKWNGKDIVGLDPASIVEKGITRSFQDGRMVNDILAWEHVALGFKLAQGRSLLSSLAHIWERKIIRQRRVAATDILGSLEIAHLAEIPVSKLSVGQRRLVALATCIATDSTCYLFDEPTAGLDAKHTSVVTESIMSLSEKGKTVVLVEHNHAFVDNLSAELLSFDV